MTGKQEVITLKVDSDLADLLKGLPNRSEFIRTAILSALDHVCPLCQGSGILTPAQQDHWKEFSHHHHLSHCHDCGTIHIACDSNPEGGHPKSEGTVTKI